MIFLWLFLPIILLFYYISNNKFKNIILLIGSLIFYAWGEPKYIILMLISILVNYIYGILIDRFRKCSKFILVIAILTNLGLLSYFKYFNFFATNVNRIFNGNIIGIRDIALPIGISFYTFQILSYVIDLYKKDINVQKNIFNFALYVSFFPQLIAGPIVKYKYIEEEINDRKVNLELFSLGVRKFVYGLGKKVILANNLALIVDSIYANDISSLNTPVVLLAAITYTLQIYFDFSGYSDMAIGLGKMFGFHFPENFNLPYVSESITEFWRRWHISLSSWFKQYLYIPLGGNRKGKIRTYINLFIVFLATGLWHGAGFNFIFWGIYHGIFIIIERIFFKKLLDKNKLKFLNHIYVMLVVIIGWIFFRANGLKEGFELVKILFSFDFSKSYILLPTFINNKTILIIIISILFSGVLQSLFNKFKNKDKLTKVYNNLEFMVIIFIMLISILDLAASTYNPFIYFRF
jgi:alginate O-acetyltransferase complex protein AlgI